MSRALLLVGLHALSSRSKSSPLVVQVRLDHLGGGRSGGSMVARVSTPQPLNPYPYGSRRSPDLSPQSKHLAGDVWLSSHWHWPCCAGAFSLTRPLFAHSPLLLWIQSCGSRDWRLLTGGAAHHPPPPLSPGAGLLGAVRVELKQNPSFFPKMERGFAPFWSFFFVQVWSHLLYPARYGLANLDTSYSKPQIDNTTLRWFFVRRYIKVRFDKRRN